MVEHAHWRSGGCILAAVTCLLTSVGLAAPPSPWSARVWQSDDGLPDNNVTGAVQTPEGYLWVATHRSLSRFDGLRFQEFAPATPGGPTTDQIRAMILDRRGRLWLAKDGGTVVCVEDGMITNVVASKEILPGAQARAITEDAQGSIWISDSMGSVFRIQIGRAQAIGTTEGLPGQGICWLATDAQGQF